MKEKEATDFISQIKEAFKTSHLLSDWILQKVQTHPAIVDEFEIKVSKPNSMSTFRQVIEDGILLQETNQILKKIHPKLYAGVQNNYLMVRMMTV